MTTTQQRFEQATQQIESKGVRVTLNVMTCCRSCTTDADRGLSEGEGESVPNLWHFGGQDNEFAFVGGEPVRYEVDDRECSCYYDESEYEYDEDGNEVVVHEGEGDVECDLCRYGRKGPVQRPVEGFYLYHAGPALTAAEVAAEAFRANGFEVNWNGTEDQALYVSF